MPSCATGWRESSLQRGGTRQLGKEWGWEGTLGRKSPRPPAGRPLSHSNRPVSVRLPCWLSGGGRGEESPPLPHLLLQGFRESVDVSFPGQVCTVVKGDFPSLALSSFFFTAFSPEKSPQHVNLSWCLLLRRPPVCVPMCGSFPHHLSVRATHVMGQEGTASGTAGVFFHLLRDLTAARTFKGHVVPHRTPQPGEMVMWTLLEHLWAQVPASFCESIRRQ